MPFDWNTYSNSLKTVGHIGISKWNDLNADFLKLTLFANLFCSVDNFHTKPATMHVYCIILGLPMSHFENRIQFAELI